MISTSARLVSGSGRVVTTCGSPIFTVLVAVEGHGLPDSGVAVANAGNPVPAFGGDESRAVEAHDSAVFSGAAFDRLLLRNSGMRRRRDAHRQNICSDRPSARR